MGSGQWGLRLLLLLLVKFEGAFGGSGEREDAEQDEGENEHADVRAAARRTS